MIQVRVVSRVLVGLVALGAASFAAEAKPASVATAHAAVAREAAATLSALFDEAIEQEHEYQAALIGRILVRFDPNHEKAREHLGDERKDGAWIIAKGPVDYVDDDEDEAETFAERALSKQEALATKLWDLVDRKATKDGDAQRHLIEDLAVLVPDDPKLEGRHRFTARDGYWITLDIEHGEKTWLRWRRASKHVIDKRLKFSPLALPPILLKADIPWIGGIWMDHLRGWSTVNPGRINLCGRRAVAMLEIFRSSFDKGADLPRDFAFILLDNKDHIEPVVDALGLTGQAKRDAMRRTPARLPGRPLVLVTETTRVATMSAMIRMAALELLGQSFGNGKESEWLHRGIAAAFEFCVIGRRIVFVGDPGSRRGSTPQLQELEAEMGKLEASWPALAGGLRKKKQLPRLADIVGRSRDEIYLPEILTAYLVGFYVALVHPGKTVRLLKQLGKDVPASKAIPDVLNMPLVELEKRALRYWSDNGGQKDFGERVGSPLPR